MTKQLDEKSAIFTSQDGRITKDRANNSFRARDYTIWTQRRRWRLLQRVNRPTNHSNMIASSRWCLQKEHDVQASSPSIQITGIEFPPGGPQTVAQKHHNNASKEENGTRGCRHCQHRSIGMAFTWYLSASNMLAHVRRAARRQQRELPRLPPTVIRATIQQKQTTTPRRVIVVYE
jgi:hypothetical protein